MVDLFRGVGLDAGLLCREAGLDPDGLKSQDLRYAPDRISALWEAAVARSRDPQLGLALPDVPHPVGFDSIAYAMMSCSNLLEGFERLLRYIRIVSDAAHIGLHREQDGYRMTLTLEDGGRPIPRARIEFVLITILNLCRWLTGRDLRPVAAGFPYPAPADTSAYSRAFRCPLHFDAPVHQLRFSMTDLSAPLPMANPELAVVVDRMAGEHLKRLDKGGASYRVRELIIKRLPDGDPSRAEIAREMCLSERTLQRRLQEEETSFNELVDDARRTLAERYLKNTDLPLSQVVCLLGFADQSTFFRACKRWFDTSPGDYRRLWKQGAQQAQHGSASGQ